MSGEKNECHATVSTTPKKFMWRWLISKSCVNSQSLSVKWYLIVGGVRQKKSKSESRNREKLLNYSLISISSSYLCNLMSHSSPVASIINLIDLLFSVFPASLLKLHNGWNAGFLSTQHHNPRYLDQPWSFALFYGHSFELDHHRVPSGIRNDAANNLQEIFYASWPSQAAIVVLVQVPVISDAATCGYRRCATRHEVEILRRYGSLWLHGEFKNFKIE